MKGIGVGMIAGVVVIMMVHSTSSEAQSKDNVPPPGFTALFNGQDLTGWQALLELPGLRSGAGLDPAEPLKLSPEERAAKQREADAKYLPHWIVRDGVLHYDGKGQNLRTVKDYGDVELLVDWRIPAKADTGIYLRGTPQIQIWDRPGVGSGGLFNNKIGPRNPLKVADRPVGEWNTFRIRIEGDVTTVWLNGELVVDKVVYENYWTGTRSVRTRGRTRADDLTQRSTVRARIRRMRSSDPVMTFCVAPGSRTCGPGVIHAATARTTSSSENGLRALAISWREVTPTSRPTAISFRICGFGPPISSTPRTPRWCRNVAGRPPLKSLTLTS